MNLLLETMRKHFPRLNSKPYTFEDVLAVADRRNINVKICDYKPEIMGYYCIRRTPKRTKRFIVINSMLDSVDRTFIGLHELAHHFLHAPVTARQYFYCRRSAEATASKHDCEANDFALIAMIPYWMLIDYSVTPFSEIEPSLVPYLKRRQLLAERIEE